MVGSAYAADLPSRGAPPVAYVPPVPIFTWTGFYIGVNAGAAFRQNNDDNNAFFAPAPLFANNNGGNNIRFIGGGQGGFNWQVNQFVFGIEADGQALVGGNNNNNNNGFFGGNGGGSNTAFLGTARGRLGIAFDRFLVYGTGGFAYGTGGNRFNNAFITNNGDNWRVGYAAGAGIEYAIINNWSVKVEYLYTDLRRSNNNNIGLLGGGFQNDFRERNHIVRAGLNYKFNWGFGGMGGPVVARY
jgi:outer membrane immunogenic protein